ncbi:MAG: carboxypeptidase-like regulatory domain-containing protein, partial [Bacteroidales bacterium]|nr:carboxypeptidase-like regulatory domain-containing protein [Bacteroidales bacterium]
MLKNIFTSLVLLMSATLINAQSLQVKGKVFDKESSAPMQYASVVISTADSTIVAAGATAEDGSFSLNAKEGNYRLTVSFMSYKDYKADISVGKGGADLGSIELEADAESLQTAVVQARRPVIESKLDKLIMNVSEAATTQGSNARDVLCKAPGVAIDKDGNVTLNGQAVAVWIDGRPSNLSGRDLEALLKSTDASTLDKLEIMAHPSAKYDAAGSGGIIDIKLKKNHLKGLNGSVNVSGGGWYYDKFESSLSGSLNLGYRSEKPFTLIITASFTR